MIYSQQSKNNPNNTRSIQSWKIKSINPYKIRPFTQIECNNTNSKHQTSNFQLNSNDTSPNHPRDEISMNTSQILNQNRKFGIFNTEKLTFDENFMNQIPNKRTQNFLRFKEKSNGFASVYITSLHFVDPIHLRTQLSESGPITNFQIISYCSVCVEFETHTIAQHALNRVNHAYHLRNFHSSPLSQYQAVFINQQQLENHIIKRQDLLKQIYHPPKCLCVHGLNPHTCDIAKLMEPFDLEGQYEIKPQLHLIVTYHRNAASVSDFYKAFQDNFSGIPNTYVTRISNQKIIDEIYNLIKEQLVDSCMKDLVKMLAKKVVKPKLRRARIEARKDEMVLDGKKVRDQFEKKMAQQNTPPLYIMPLLSKPLPDLPPLLPTQQQNESKSNEIFDILDFDQLDDIDPETGFYKMSGTNTNDDKPSLFSDDEEEPQEMSPEPFSHVNFYLGSAKNLNFYLSPPRKDITHLVKRETKNRRRQLLQNDSIKCERDLSRMIDDGTTTFENIKQPEIQNNSSRLTPIHKIEEWHKRNYLRPYAQMRRRKYILARKSGLPILQSQFAENDDETITKKGVVWKKVYFEKSEIQGFGLFALEPISQSDFICEYTGQLIRMEVADRRERKLTKMGFQHMYLFRLETMVIDATEHGSNARFLNHSCSPNCRARQLKMNDLQKIMFFATKPIKPHDEICFNYEMEFEPNPEKWEKCYCGSKDCNGYLNYSVYRNVVYKMYKQSNGLLDPSDDSS